MGLVQIFIMPLLIVEGLLRFVSRESLPFLCFLVFAGFDLGSR